MRSLPTSIAQASRRKAEVPVMHACGHDVHVTCLLGAVFMLAEAPEAWNGTVVAVFQPAEEVADGAQGMLTDGLADLVGEPAAALCQHVLPLPAGRVATRVGPVLSAADSMRINVHGRGADGSMPQAAVEPVVLAAMIVVQSSRRSAASSPLSARPRPAPSHPTSSCSPIPRHGERR